MDSLLDTRTIPPQARPALSFAQKVALMRRPLPSHRIEGGNFRQWAAAVCSAEVKHREADYLRVERDLGANVDRYLYPDCIEVGQFEHEMRAGVALNWLEHLRAHETTKRAPFDFIPWTDWRRETRAAWIARRRYLWSGFLNAVRNYKAARSELDAFLEEVK